MPKEFTVVLRGPSALIFPEGLKPAISVTVPLASGPATAEFATRHITTGSGGTVPGQLWIEVRGHGENLDTAAMELSDVGTSFLPILAVAGNGSIRHPDIELAFDSSPGHLTRDYLQCRIPPEGAQIAEARLLPPDLALALIAAFLDSNDRARIQRAAVQYQLALENWRGGHEIQIVSHLWIAVEALTPVIKRRLRGELGLKSDDDLLAHFKIEKKELDPMIRRDYILGGDSAGYSASRSASDGLEHGYKEYDEIRDSTMPHLESVAANIRRTIFTIVGLPGPAFEALTTAPFDKPATHHPILQYLRGTLTGQRENLAPKGSHYPFVNWSVTYSAPGAGRMAGESLDQQMKFSAAVGDGVVFQFVTLEHWRP